MKKYKLLLSKDWTKQINHVVVTNLVEKGTNNFKLKSKGFGREMIIITDKDLELNKTYNLGQYKDGALLCKVVEKEDVQIETDLNLVKIFGVVSYSYVKTDDNKEYCPIDIKTSKIIEPEKLKTWIKLQTGIEPSSIKVKGINKEQISGKIIIFNQFYLEVEGVVFDIELIKKVQTQSIGKKKTYGLGFMELQKL